MKVTSAKQTTVQYLNSLTVIVSLLWSTYKRSKWLAMYNKRRLEARSSGGNKAHALLLQNHWTRGSNTFRPYIFGTLVPRKASLLFQATIRVLFVEYFFARCESIGTKEDEWPLPLYRSEISKSMIPYSTSVVSSLVIVWCPASSEIYQVCRLSMSLQLVKIQWYCNMFGGSIDAI